MSQVVEENEEEKESKEEFAFIVKAEIDSEAGESEEVEKTRDHDTFIKEFRILEADITEVVHEIKK